jgi:hypothetical protein
MKAQGAAGAAGGIRRKAGANGRLAQLGGRKRKEPPRTGRLLKIQWLPEQGSNLQHRG